MRCSWLFVEIWFNYLLIEADKGKLARNDKSWHPWTQQLPNIENKIAKAISSNVSLYALPWEWNIKSLFFALQSKNIMNNGIQYEMMIFDIVKQVSNKPIVMKIYVTFRFNESWFNLSQYPAINIAHRSLERGTRFITSFVARCLLLVRWLPVVIQLR